VSPINYSILQKGERRRRRRKEKKTPRKGTACLLNSYRGRLYLNIYTAEIKLPETMVMVWSILYISLPSKGEKKGENKKTGYRK
jgi:hypothetical protein